MSKIRGLEDQAYKHTHRQEANSIDGLDAIIDIIIQLLKKSNDIFTNLSNI